jgi:hypothetical protein
LPHRLKDEPDHLIASTLELWKYQSQSNPPTEACSHIQKSWDTPIVEKMTTFLLDHASDDYHRARLLATRSQSASDWLTALPLSSIGLRLDNEAIRIAVALRLGSVVCEPHICRCGKLVDARGGHCLSCKFGSGKFIRHNLLNDVIWRSLNKAQIPSIKEPPGLFRNDGKRTDGVTLIPWSHGKCLTWDVTVPDTVAASHLGVTSLMPASAAEKAPINKEKKYEQLLHSHHFVAVAVETFGSWSEDGLKFVNELGKRLEIRRTARRDVFEAEAVDCTATRQCSCFQGQL